MGVEIIRLAGTAYEMGRRHGELCRTEIHERIRLSLDRRDDVTDENCVALAREHLPAHEAFAPEVFEELRGIADGAEIDLAELLIGNGYTDFVDVLRGRRHAGPCACTAFICGPEATADGRRYIGQTWDMHSSARPFVRAFDRRPAAGPRSVTLTTTGCLSLIGLNECGVAIGNNNLVPNDARPGVIYLALIHHTLAQQTAAAARDAIAGAQRASGHNYYLADAGGALNLETTATDLETIEPGDGIYTHANHYTSERLQNAYAAREPDGNSVGREERLRTELSHPAGKLALAQIAGALSFHGGDHDMICRHGDRTCTCAAAIMCPDTRTIWMTAGNPCEHTMVECRV